MNVLKTCSYIFIAFFASVLLFYNCASKVPPSGGPRDTIPPKLIYSNPKHQSTNVHTRVYEFNFDERIQLKNINKELIITPRIDFDYDIKYGKTSFILVFDENFKDSVTYTFNFREAIQDLTEGNPTEDNKFTFSTGPFLDSISVEGHVINLMTNDSLKDVTIGLFPIEDTVTIFTGSPYYFNETDEEGYYKIENIKNGKYLLYAFTDKNKNLKLDTKNEAYGWVTDTLDLNENLKEVNIKLYNLDLRLFRNVSNTPSGKNFDLNFNKYATDFSISPLDSAITVFANLVKENKSIRIYQTFEQTDSTGIYYHAYDSVSNELADTIWVKFLDSGRKPEEFNFSITPKNSEDILEYFEAEIKTNKPVVSVSSDSILFRVDTVTISRLTSDDQLEENKHHNQFHIYFNLSKGRVDSVSALLDSLRQGTLNEQVKEDSLASLAGGNTKKKTIKQANQVIQTKGLHLYLGKGSFVSVENDTSARQAVNYKFIKPEEYGSIKGKVVSNDKSYILQLLDKQNKVAKETHTNNTFNFSHIKPGEYKLRVLIDENKNGVWDLGNMESNQPPEPVYFYVSPDGHQWITVRANWEITDLSIE